MYNSLLFLIICFIFLLGFIDLFLYLLKMYFKSKKRYWVDFSSHGIHYFKCFNNLKDVIVYIFENSKYSVSFKLADLVVYDSIKHEYVYGYDLLIGGFYD